MPAREDPSDSRLRDEYTGWVSTTYAPGRNNTLTGYAGYLRLSARLLRLLRVGRAAWRSERRPSTRRPWRHL
eukprot:12308895-Prorocentrum_lima.AAC.1